MTTQASSRFAIAGLVLGLLSVLGGSLHFFLGPIEPAPSIENVVQEKTAALKDAIIAGIKGQKPEKDTVTKREYSSDDIAQATAVGTGVIALALGIIGLVRREPMRESVPAMVIGSAAIVLPLAIKLVLIVLGMMFIIALIGSIGDILSF